jgi:hypothetical protein
VPLEHLSEEISRFDIDLAALEIGNPFCEAKSELKFLEATLVDVPTIASPTGPFRRAFGYGETGFLAATLGEWHETLLQLVGTLRCAAGLQRPHGAKHRGVSGRSGGLS